MIHRSIAILCSMSAACSFAASACSSRDEPPARAVRDGGSADAGPSVQPDSGVARADAGGGAGVDSGGVPTGCRGSGPCYTVYAHGDHVLYKIDLPMRTLVTVGPFDAPMVPRSGGGMAEDVITDLAVAPDDTIYAVSNTALYTASPTDGHVTRVGPVTACGTVGVALTFLPDGRLYTGDFMGAFCRVDPATSPPTVTPIAMLSDGYALAGDLVAVADGTMYGTVYRLGDPSGGGAQANNLLARIDPTTGAVTIVGSTGFPKLFGVAYQLGQVFGFTHDGSGHVITIDPHAGAGSVYGTFTDPSTGRGISFAGAAVNAMVPPTLI